MNEARLAQARAWMRQDPDHETRDELAGLITRAASGEERAVAELDDRFGSRLAFGTAGLRGELGAGSNRMNRVLVAQAAAGFASYLREKAHGGTPTVVVGYDGRRFVVELSGGHLTRDVDEAVRTYVRWFEARILEQPASWSFLADRRWRAVLRAAARRVTGT